MCIILFFRVRIFFIIFPIDVTLCKWYNIGILKRKGATDMTRQEILNTIAAYNPSLIRQVTALLDCKARFCKITMKPNPEEDMRKRGGKPRVFHVNVRASYDHMMKRHYDEGYSFNPSINTSAMKARNTCTERAILGVVETVNVGGKSVLQYRNVDLKKIASIQCGDIMENFI